MSKLHLKKILNCSEIPKLIVYFDSWDVCGRHVIWSHVKSHLRDETDVHYLCYSRNPSELSAIYNKDQENLKFYDLHSDPLQWEENYSKYHDARKSFFDLIPISKCSAERKSVVVIDKITCATNYLSETDLIRNIQILKNAECIHQVIVLCGEDASTSHFVCALRSLSSSTITLNNTSPTTCNVLLKKKSGKILRSTEEFLLNSNLELEYCREFIAVDATLSKLDLGNSGGAAFETTFNLSLTEHQKKAKNKLVLPHTRIQSMGGHIHYVPEAEDDWDDEDPDEDLEI